MGDGRKTDVIVYVCLLFVCSVGCRLSRGEWRVKRETKTAKKELFRELSQVFLSNPLTHDCISGAICESETRNMLIDSRK
jgi:hypothetical protein